MPQPSEDVSTMDTCEADYNQVLQESQNVLRQCFKEYALDEIFVTFNGGKDCTVLLDIVIELLRDIHQTDSAELIKVMYIRTGSPFRELEEFVQQIEQHFGIKLVVTEGDMKESLARILEEDKRLKVCLMGTRRTDPYSQDMNFMQETDANWPKLMRVSPLLNWNYHQIWSYIRERNVPYCSLYDQGYTSIGSTLNTWPNPSLAYKDSSGRISYLPAWKLEDGSLERQGRGTKPTLSLKSLANGHESNVQIEDGNTNGTK
ncbi:hypothetical protein JYU34_016802 [Plutella xylostella]|uniref:FAD synthase n=1 Tax=Plutella xylostella TaxID=51655 RepID=A0ABQ7Q4H2_PLUXY|nr:hypothetical protein JYU34_016802 [Plutella xylostella]